MADETDLDILNSCMETMVDYFQDELAPVAAQLAARLVCQQLSQPFMS
jgi:importin-7